MEKLGEVINSPGFDQIGYKNRLGSHFWEFWTHWRKSQNQRSTSRYAFFKVNLMGAMVNQSVDSVYGV